MALGWLWVAAKMIELITSGSSLQLARALDFTNPSLFGILGFSSLIASFFVGRKQTV
jgi:tetratricopeptide (TPR) repeat protein